MLFPKRILPQPFLSSIRLIFKFALAGIAVACANPVHIDPTVSSSSDTGQLIVAGKTIYSENCVFCHQALEISTKRGVSVEQVNSALTSRPEMSFLNLSAEQVAALAMALKN